MKATECAREQVQAVAQAQEGRLASAISRLAKFVELIDRGGPRVRLDAQMLLSIRQAREDLAVLRGTLRALRGAGWREDELDDDDPEDDGGSGR